MNFFLKKLVVFSFLAIADNVRRLLMRWELAFGILFLPSLGGFRKRVGLWKAWRAYSVAARTCPAYAEFLAAHPQARVKLNGWTPDFSAIPPMDTGNYIKAYSMAAKCRRGRIPMRGAVIDESSGSTGKAKNWIRGEEERRYVARMLQISLHQMLGGRPLMFINAFALGPWATGMTVSMAVVDICLLKSTGPEVQKIINTLNDFGPEFRYVIAGYPPFLKMLADCPDVDWSKYDITAFFGGEAISENMRAYLLKSFRGGIYGDYGASDLEINIAAETDFTVALRQLMATNDEVRKALNGVHGDAVPSVFQYNPLDYVIETNDDGELLVTICRTTNTSPRIRYNIHDLGHTVEFSEIQARLRAAGVDPDTLPRPLAHLPLLFMYGRSDFSVGYYGCKITPGEVEALLYGMPELAPIINAFALVTSEDANNNKHLSVCLELAEGAHAPTGDAELAALRDEVFNRLAQSNQDFRESRRMVPAGYEPQIEFHPKASGPFANNDIRVKCRYIQERPKA
jgi:phenylacetate-CoA ligase